MTLWGILRGFAFTSAAVCEVGGVGEGAHSGHVNFQTQPQTNEGKSIAKTNLRYTPSGVFALCFATSSPGPKDALGRRTDIGICWCGSGCEVV